MGAWNLLAILFVVGFAQPPATGEEEVAATPTDQLVAACEKLATADSYRFVIETKLEGRAETPRGGRGRRGGVSTWDRPTPKIEGEFQTGAPLRLAVGRSLAFRERGNTVVRGESGKWEVLGRPTAGPSRGRPAASGEDNALAAFRVAQPPHEILADIGGMVAEVTRRKTAAGIVYEGSLTERGVTKFGGPGLAPRRGARRGGEGEPRGGAGELSEPKPSGTIQVVVGRDGWIDSVEVRAGVEFTRDGRDASRARTVTMSLRAFGKTLVSIPDEALERLRGGN